MAKKLKKKPKRKARISSKRGFGHATHVEGTLWNVWFHLDSEKGNSLLVGNCVQHSVAMTILEEIDKTGEVAGISK